MTKQEKEELYIATIKKCKWKTITELQELLNNVQTDIEKMVIGSIIQEELAIENFNKSRTNYEGFYW